MDEFESPTADDYRHKAEEIRQLARRTRTLEIVGEPLELAERFDRMARFVEQRDSKV
jgi:hypothetical protein